MTGILLSFAITIRFYSINNNACYFLSVLLASVSTRIPLQHHNHQYFRSLAGPRRRRSIILWSMLDSRKLAATSSSSSSSCHLSCSMGRLCKIVHIKTILSIFSLAWSSMWFFSMHRLFSISQICILHLSWRTLVSHCWTELSTEACLCWDCRGRHLC